MFITWLGHSCFRIQEKELTFIIDPYDQKVAAKPPIIKKAELIALTNPSLVDFRKYKDTFVIEGPGEYEMKGVFVHGFDAGQSNTVYFIQWTGISFAHLGNISHDLTAEQLEMIEEVDILMIPVGGHGVYNSKKASAIIQDIEPRVVIPMSYKIPGLKVSADPLDGFVKEMGIKDQQVVDKVKITKKDLPSGETLFYLLKNA